MTCEWCECVKELIVWIFWRAVIVIMVLALLDAISDGFFDWMKKRRNDARRP